MIRCLLINISHNQRGQVIRQERRLSYDSLSIGRGSECKIQLPDHRVSLHQATIKHGDDGRLYIASEPSHLIEVDHHQVDIAAIAAGMRITIGPYELTVDAITGNDDIILSCECIQADTTAAAPTLPTNLGATGLSMRKPALWFAGIIALFFIVLPISYTLHPGLKAAAQQYHLTLDTPLNAGSMSSGHRALSVKCDTCHQKPFTPVSDQVCENCHKSVQHHITDPELQAQVFKKVPCSSCHQDHRGKKGLVRQDNQQCVSCHGKIKISHRDTELADIHDFSTDHPPFKLTFNAGPNSLETRVAQSEKSKLVEHSGLKFSHAEHFDKALTIMADGNIRDISCADCHVPSESGIGFNPMTMPLTCQQSKCHSLQLTPPIEGRVIEHASEKTVMRSLREMFSGMAINDAHKESASIDQLARARQWVASEVARNAKAFFTTEGEGTCLECHEITADKTNKETPWKVATVNMTAHWLPKAHFPHEKHSTEKCSSCHDVQKSELSSDVAIPTIEKCRECHVGSKQAKTLVSSTCNTCHSFHKVKTEARINAEAED
jgi:predicted CXXCH cytochrome family protein